MEIYHDFRNLLVQEDSMVQIGLRLILGEKLNRVSLINEYYLSETPLKERLKLLREVFQIYGIDLKGRDGKLFLSGDEAIIRKVGLMLINDIFSENQWPIDHVSEKEVMAEIKEVVDISKLTKRQLHDLMFETGIMLSRTQRGCSFERANIFEDFQESLDRFLEEYAILDTHFKISEVEKSFFILNLLSKEWFCLQSIGKKFIKLNHQTKNEFTKLLEFSEERLIHYFPEMANCAFDLELALFCQHLSKILYPTWKGDIYKNDMIIHDVKLFERAELLVKELISYSPKYIVGDYDFLIKQYISLIYLLADRRLYEKHIAVYVSGLDSEVEQIILEKFIRETYNQFFKINFVRSIKESNVFVEVGRYSPRITTHPTDQNVMYGKISPRLQVRDMMLLSKILQAHELRQLLS